ncbi:hypothetical protein EW145_g6414 [Phellinidium pouzarii]|uniref:TFIIS-type domain-containing protein n=1 Tax=Phellinidium pouzarii TaxID=167371 RepID=A0A4S4KWQ7_9AGAM|nr:hypothetical protein EW145_g6414 [Phellinidium pouzarii]
MTSRERLRRKDVDDVLGGEATWRDADSTSVACPKCDNDRAYFYQLQIRSADEPMTTYAQHARINGEMVDLIFCILSKDSHEIYLMIIDVRFIHNKEGKINADAGEISGNSQEMQPFRLDHFIVKDDCCAVSVCIRDKRAVRDAKRISFLPIL